MSRAEAFTTWTFIEFPAFTRDVDVHFGSDAAYSRFQRVLATKPDCGSVMEKCGGFRKARWSDPMRKKGTRSGLRVIYLLVPAVRAIVLAVVYDKGQKDDLNARQKKELAQLAAGLKKEILDLFTPSKKGAKQNG